MGEGLLQGTEVSRQAEHGISDVDFLNQGIFEYAYFLKCFRSLLDEALHPAGALRIVHQSCG